MKRHDNDISHHNFITYFMLVDAVRCRICNQALSLDDCTRSVECSPDEVNQNLTSRYD